MHGVHRIDHEMFALYGLTDFVHQLWIVERLIRIDDQRVACVEQMMLRKINYVLALGGCSVQRVQFHTVCACADFCLG